MHKLFYSHKRGNILKKEIRIIRIILSEITCFLYKTTPNFWSNYSNYSNFFPNMIFPNNNRFNYSKLDAIT